jgi:uncharacterized membrane protein
LYAALPPGLASAHLFSAYQGLISTGSHFASVYLLSHGAVKLVLVLALLKDKLWAYPTMIAGLAGLVFYQVYRVTLNPSLIWAALTVFDILVIVLARIEYQEQKSDRQASL